MIKENGFLSETNSYLCRSDLLVAIFRKLELAPTTKGRMLLILILFSNYFAINYFANYNTACILLADQCFSGDV